MTSLAFNIQQTKLNSSFLHWHQDSVEYGCFNNPLSLQDAGLVWESLAPSTLLNPSQDNVKKGIITTNSIYLNSCSVPVSLESCSSVLSSCLKTLMQLQIEKGFSLAYIFCYNNRALHFQTALCECFLQNCWTLELLTSSQHFTFPNFQLTKSPETGWLPRYAIKGSQGLNICMHK